jgi:predicted RNA binding protein YcfA (HicA-like mRNA interferase family)
VRRASACAEAFVVGAFLLREFGTRCRQLRCRVSRTSRRCIVHSRDVIKALRADGWREVRVSGSHHQFRHPEKPGTVTVPHPLRDLRVGTLKSIERQAGIRF